MLVVPGVGEVAFPTSMSHEEAETRAKDLSELREKNEEKLRTTNRISQITAAKFAAALWLLPVAAMYGLGWAVAWIRRGFAAARVCK